jgi:hypothetical protein
MPVNNVIRKKRGRPPIGKKAAKLIALRLPDEIDRGVRAYAKANKIGSQSEAIRHMIEIVLKGRAG